MTGPPALFLIGSFLIRQRGPAPCRPTESQLPGHSGAIRVAAFSVQRRRPSAPQQLQHCPTFIDGGSAKKRKQVLPGTRACTLISGRQTVTKLIRGRQVDIEESKINQGNWQTSPASHLRPRYSQLRLRQMGPAPCRPTESSSNTESWVAFHFSAPQTLSATAFAALSYLQ